MGLIHGLSIALKMCIYSTFSCVLYVLTGSIIYELGIVKLRNYMVHSKDVIAQFLNEHLGIWMTASMETTTNRDTVKLLFALCMGAISLTIIKFMFWLESRYLKENIQIIKNLGKSRITPENPK